MSCTIGMKSVGHDPAGSGALMISRSFGVSVMMAAGRVRLSPPDPGKTPGQAEGDRETVDENVGDRKRAERPSDADRGRDRTPHHHGAGISELPPEAEEGQQAEPSSARVTQAVARRLSGDVRWSPGERFGGRSTAR